MNRRRWLFSALAALPLAIGGAVYANSNAMTYTCPLTGEQLACEKCCPFNKASEQAEGYICPATGETLPCPNCCPLNQDK